MHSGVIFGILMLGAIGMVFLSIRCFSIYQNKKNPKASFKGAWTNRPGHCLLSTIDQCDQTLQRSFFALGATAVVFLAVHICYPCLGRTPVPFINTAVTAFVALLLSGYYVRTIFRVSGQRNLHRLAHAGQVAVGQELASLKDSGYTVFHDVPADNSSIDHIVVGPAGIMVVKTLVHAKGRNQKRTENAVVVYDGRMLHFPGFSDYKAIDQAEQQVLWLSGWLSAELGGDICARAMVVIPDWSVKRTSADGLSVVNPRQIAVLFRYIRPRPLPENLKLRVLDLVAERGRGDDDNQPATKETAP